MIQCQGWELKGGGEDRNWEDGNGPLYYKARGSKNDSVEVLLDRIQWSTYLHKRANIWQRAFIIALIITLLIFLIVLLPLNKWCLPYPGYIILVLIVSWLVILMGYSYFYTHGDIYNDYYVYRNVELLREKMNVVGKFRDDVDDPWCDDLPDRPEMMIK